MRLLYVFPEPLPLNKARAIQVVNTVHSLGKRGMEVTLAYEPAGLTGAELFAAYGLDLPEGVELLPVARRLPWPLSTFRFHSGKLFQWRLGRWIRRQIPARRPQAVFVRHLKVAGYLTDHFSEIPMVYEAHEVFAEGALPRKRGALEELERKVLLRAGRVISITAQLADRLRSYYDIDRAMEIIPSATSPRVVPAQKEWDRASRHIVYAGNFYEWKGAQDLVAAARWLEGCRITLVGGDAKGISALRVLVSPGGAEVVFLGHLPHSQAMDVMASACIAVLPNRAGAVSDFTSPLKLFEYMAAGCAIVASDLPVFREILLPDEAEWFEAGSAKSLAEAIRRLTQDCDAAARLGRLMTEKVLNFTWAARAARLETVIAAAITNPPDLVLDSRTPLENNNA